MPAGNGYKALKVTDFKDKFEIRPGIFFDDVRVVSFAYPAVAPGVRTVCDYTVRHSDARFLMPVLLCQLRARAPRRAGHYGPAHGAPQHQAVQHSGRQSHLHPPGKGQ